MNNANDGDGGRLPDGRFGPGNTWAIRPGETRNPRGRPVSLARIIRERLAEDDARDAERVVRALIEAAAGGDVPAVRLLPDRVDGKVPDRLTTETAEERAEREAAESMTDAELFDTIDRIRGERATPAEAATHTG